MSATNTDALTNQQVSGGHSGEFSSKVAPAHPLQDGGHKPGVLAGNDAVPEHHVQTLPAGTAPASRTFEANNEPEVGGGATSASASLGGATSADVNAGMGKPIQGETSAELHHDGQAHRKNPGQGLDNPLPKDN